MNPTRRQNKRVQRAGARSTNNRYAPRGLFDQNHSEGKDLWDVSKSQAAMHPGANDPNSIAAHVMGSLVHVPDSVPNNTFKNGAYPHTYTTLNYQENPEPDTASLMQSLSPLEFASLANMTHHLPANEQKKFNQPVLWSQGRDDMLRAKRKWKTSDGMSPRFSPYQSTAKTSTNIGVLKAAKSNAGMNRSMLAPQSTPSQDNVKSIVQKDDQARAADKLLGKENTNRLRKLITRIPGILAKNGPSGIFRDPDFTALMKNGARYWTESELNNYLPAATVKMIFNGVP